LRGSREKEFSEMFDKYMIVGEEFRNVVQDGKVTGFQLGMRLPYYRGVVLSLLGDTELTVDDERFDPEQITLTVNGHSFGLSDIKDETEEKWEFGDIGILTVDKPGGLARGEHTVGLRQHMVISYILSFGGKGFFGHDRKQLTLAS
jgi:hypothetical protein